MTAAVAISTGIDDPSAAITIKPSMIVGSASIASLTRLMPMSIQPPLTAASMPSVIPIR